MTHISEVIPIGKVQAPVAFSSSNKVDIMGKSFCLLSSLDIKPLSSFNTLRQKKTEDLLWVFLLLKTAQISKQSATIVKKKKKESIIHYLQSCEVPRQLFHNWLQGTRVGLSITNEAEVKQEGVSTVLFMFDAHRTPNQLFPHGSA